MKIKPKRYIVWSTKKEINLDNLFLKKWYISQVLTKGCAKDIAKLDWKELKKIISEINLPKHIKSLWENYFNAKK